MRSGPASEVSDDVVLLGRDDMSDFNEANILRQPPQKLAEILDWLKPTDYAAVNGEYSKHLASHEKGTGDWLLCTGTYRQWHVSRDEGMLWIKGIPGSG